MLKANISRSQSISHPELDKYVKICDHYIQIVNQAAYFKADRYRLFHTLCETAQPELQRNSNFLRLRKNYFYEMFKEFNQNTKANLALGKLLMKEGAMLNYHHSLCGSQDIFETLQRIYTEVKKTEAEASIAANLK
jgi:hypothetical protein